MKPSTNVRASTVSDGLTEKQRSLHDALRDCGSVVIGYSGGVDSAYLAKAALEALGPDRVLAVTGRSPSYPEVQCRMALEVARTLGLPHIEIETRELDNPDYAANPADRCYHCKNELFARLGEIARQRNATVIDGSNADDRQDYRPGMLAAREHGVRSPLQEAGLSKAEIRELSRRVGLPTWDLPAAPCLASRIPYGIEVTPRRLRQIEAAEASLRTLRQWQEMRVRHHGDLARVEFAADDLPALQSEELLSRIGDALASAGFRAGCVDLAGYRRGGLNEAIPEAGATGTGPASADGGGGSGDGAVAEAGLAALEITGRVQPAGPRGDVALVRVGPGRAATLVSGRDQVVEVCRAAGFRHVGLALI
jgi:uncharacterized protein